MTTPPACLDELFGAWVTAAPQSTAVVAGEQRLTYRQLDERANRIAHTLRALGVGADDRVALAAERGPGMIAGLLGVVKAGAGYVPLDPGYPPERLAFMLRDSRARLLLTEEPLLPALGEPATPLLCLDRDRRRIDAAPAAAPRRRSGPDHLAWMIYTSGSTGRPKGALVPHRGLAALAREQARAFGVGPGSRVLQFSSLSFDASSFEVVMALTHGAALVLGSRDELLPGPQLLDFLRRHAVTLVTLPPSALRALPQAELPALATITVAGEACPAEIVERWAPGRRFWNLYGPTEATIWSTAAELVAGGPPPHIGWPIPGTEAHLLDEHGRPVPDTDAGELQLGGVGLARGYFGRPGLTAQRFVPHPASREPGARLYRTGDLVRRRPDGALDFLGRIDHQVKLRGFRIELGEIEAALAEHPAVEQAVVLLHDPSSESPRLVAWLIAASEAGAPAPEELRTHLRRHLPEHMLPAVFGTLEALPLMPSGKVDRAALRGRGLPQRAEPHEAPRTPLEQRLAGLWQEVLGAGRVGLRDPFTALGGDSLRAARVVNQLQESLAETVHVSALFEAPTVGELAAYLERHYPDAAARICGGAPSPAAPDAAPQRHASEPDLDRLRRLIVPLAPAPGAAGAAPRNPPAVFVLAPPRSGSTVFRVMLGGHPRLFAPPELELLSFNSLAQRRQVLVDRLGFLREGTIRALMELESCGAEQAERLMARSEAEGLTVRAFYRRLQERLGERLLVDKSTTYAQDPAVLRRAEEDFEGALYLHLVRHPCAVVRSFTEARIDRIFRFPHPFSARLLGELLWQLAHDNVRRFLAEVPPERQLRVVFEDLLARPEEVLAEVCGFLGIEPHPDMADPYRHVERRMVDGLYPESRPLGDTKIRRHKKLDPSVAERWKGHVDPASLGDGSRAMARSLGYADVPTPAESPPAPLLQRGEHEAPLSFAQQRLWFLDQLGTGAAYHSLHCFRLDGTLDGSILAAGLDAVVRRHGALRTSFPVVGQAPVQRVAVRLEVPLPRVDLADLLPGARQREVRRLAAAAARRPFDLARGPLLRAALLRLAAAEHLFLVSFHHIVCDGWSLGVFLSELAACYRAFAAGGVPRLPPLPVQLTDFARWQRRLLTAESLAPQLAYWRRQLAGAPVLQLPADRPRPTVRAYRGGNLFLRLPAAAGDALEHAARVRGATPAMALMAAFKALLARTSHQVDVVVGTPISGRTRRQLEGLIGFFVNTLVLRTDLAGDPAFDEILDRERRLSLDAYDHQEVPFERLVEELDPERDLDRNPLFQVAFMVQEAPWDRLELPGLAVRRADLAADAARVDLEVHVWRSAGELRSRWLYDRDLFDAATVHRLARRFARLLESAAADPATRLSELALLGPGERHQLLVEWTPGREPRPAELRLDAMFARWVATAPEQTALLWGDRRLSYRELDERAGRLAHTLRQLGAGTERRVAIAARRGPGAVVGLLGILKAGAAFVPLDPAYPAERLAFMLRDSRARILLTEEHLLPALPHDGVEVPCLDRDRRRIAAAPAAPPPAPEDAAQLAYVIYTSGSTGRPKGVLVSHRGLAAVAREQARAFGIGRRSRVLQFSSASFDASIFEVVMALAHGATLVLGSREELLPGDGLLALLRRHAVSVVTLPPSALLALPEPPPPELATITVAGEACPAQLVERFAPGRRFWNLYGPTEATIWSTMAELETGGTAPHIGRPIAGTELYLLDPALRPVAPGVIGEIYLGGAGLARGYHGRPGLTAERFLPHPHGERPGERLYRTGDLARHLADGRLDFLGRADHQVKLRGFRIELGEIEALLTEHPAVSAAVVELRGGSRGEPGTQRLAAHVARADDAPAGSVLLGALRSHLRRRLPEHMVPQAWSLSDALPLLPSGKVDRGALARAGLDETPQPAGDDDEQAPGHVAPRDGTEELLAALWAEVLDVPRPGVHDDFFDLGGHSLLATRLASRIRDTLELELPLQALFEHRTVAGLADHLRRGEAAAAAPPIVAEPRDAAAPLPLSFAQQRLWFLDQLGAGTAYNMRLAFRLRGELDAALLAASLEAVVRRHEALRTRFPAAAGQPRQVIEPALAVAVAEIDLTGLPAARRRKQARRWAVEEARRPFDLGRGPLLRCRLLRLGAAAQDAPPEHVLLLTLHHIVSDGWSMGVLVGELSAAWRALSAGAAPRLPPLPVQVADFALWQRRWLADGALDAQLAFWRRQLGDGLGVLALPTDRPRPAVQTFRGAVVSTRIPAAAGDRLRDLAKRRGATLAITLQAAFKALLGRLTSQSDVAIGVPIANRNRSEVEGLIGFFVNLLVMRTDLSGDPTGGELLDRERRVALAAYDHQDLPFERLVEEIDPQRDLSRNPLVQVAFAMHDADAERLDLPGLHSARFESGAVTIRVDLELHAWEAAPGLLCRFAYNADLFDATTVRRLAGQWRRLLAGFAAPQTRLSQLTLLGAAQRQQLLVEWSDTGRPFAEAALVHELVAAQAAAAPRREAVLWGEQRLSYGELEGRANQLAHALRARGVAADEPVGLCVERGPGMIVGLLGILKAGGAYVPLDPSYPAAHLEFMLGDCGARLLVGEAAAVASLPEHEARPLLLDGHRREIATLPRGAPPRVGTPSGLAYLIYTSGSTGMPKGALVPHRGLVSLAREQAELFGVGPGDRVLQFSSLSFDASSFEILMALTHGATLVLARREAGAELGELLRRRQVSLVTLTPTTLASKRSAL